MKILWIYLLLIIFLKKTISKKVEKINNKNSWRNIDINRKIDLSKPYVEEIYTITIQNMANAPLNEYFWIISKNLTNKISYIKAKEKNKESFSLNISAVKENYFEDVDLYIIKLSKPIPSQKSITIEINISVTDILKPFPPMFLQNQDQLLIWEGLKYSLSMYPTEKQKTLFKINTDDIFSYSQYHENNSTNPLLLKSHLIYNFHNTVAPFNKETIYIHYKYNKPIAVVKRLEREIEVSHWGNNIAVRNTYSITNTGTRLKENFSRIKWNQQLYYQSFHAVISLLQIDLKTKSRNLYHVDEIGIVSSSKFISSPKNTLIKIKPRYPIYGGWNYSCTVGWNLDLNNFLKKKDNNIYILKIPFIDGPIDVYYKNVSVNIILPEGSRILDIISHTPILKSKVSTHKTYMDIIGRTSIKLYSKNLIDTISSEDIFVLYYYSLWKNFRKPLTISIIIGLLFLSLSLLRKVKIKI